MEKPSDYHRRIINASYDRERLLATVNFGSTEEEQGAMLRGDAVAMNAWVTLADGGDYDLVVTSDDPRLDRPDVRARIIAAYNKVWGRHYDVESCQFVIDPQCFER